MRSFVRKAAAVAASSLIVLAASGSGTDKSNDHQTMVTFTFDDNWADQKGALDVLQDYEMNATIYTNSGTVGTSNHLTLDQLRAYNSHGFEIAGHTLDHKDLAKISPEEARHEICDDRAVLINDGFRVTSFAYPFGSFNKDVKKIPKTCGYNSARSLPGLRSAGYGNACVDDCPPSESIPPGDLWEIKTPTTVRNSTTLDILKDEVTQVEKTGGGWMPMVFHHICDRCADNSIDIETFTKFVDWLDHRPSSTVVRTTDQVIGGDFQGPAGTTDKLGTLPPAAAPPAPADRPLIRAGKPSNSTAFTVLGIDVGQSQVLFVGILMALSSILTYRLATRGNRRRGSNTTATN